LAYSNTCKSLQVDSIYLYELNLTWCCLLELWLELDKCWVSLLWHQIRFFSYNYFTLYCFY